MSGTSRRLKQVGPELVFFMAGRGGRGNDAAVGTASCIGSILGTEVNGDTRFDKPGFDSQVPSIIVAVP